jgi:methyltransferase FkbM-like protein
MYILCAAIHGDAARPIAIFDIAVRARASNALRGFGGSQTGGVAESRVVPAITLDQLLETFRTPSVVKIDVEGAEVAVLLGARRLLREIRPTLILEVGSQNQAEVGDILRAVDYAVLNGEESNWPEVSSPTWASIAIPKERYHDPATS